MALQATFGKLKDILGKIYPNALKITGNGAIAAFLYVFEEMLEKISPCPCIPDWNTTYTVIVFTVPAVILYMFCAFVDPDSQSVLKCGPGCTRPRRKTSGSCKVQCPCIQCCFPTKTLMKVGIPSVLWIVIVFLDGSYYTCSKVQNATREMCENYCSSNTTRSSPDQDYYCFKSRMIGSILLAATVTLLVLLYFLSAWKCGYCTEEGYYEAIYQNMLEKEKQTNKMEELENKAKEDAKESVKDTIAELNLGEPKQNVQRPNVPAGSMGETIPMIPVRPKHRLGH
ncbi:uncharacterized protein [Hemitrygon akajei]|uniref:uncharacterized protein n=1 Tax=Hemitrygon akajei TaxID=2704970 RepID=UPI003BF956FD